VPQETWKVETWYNAMDDSGVYLLKVTAKWSKFVTVNGWVGWVGVIMVSMWCENLRPRCPRRLGKLKRGIMQGMIVGCIY
jgi:hypothetical protein